MTTAGAAVLRCPKYDLSLTETGERIDHRMTMDSLREIAEEKADKIRADAEKTARERIAAAHAQADELVTRAEKEAHAEAAGTVADVTRRADELVKSGADAARSEAAAIGAAAGSNSDEAVKMIYWEIVEKCLRA